MEADSKAIEYLIVDTTAFLQNAQLQEIAEKMITCQEVVDEITNKRQLRRLVVLPYELSIKAVFSENLKIVTDFAKKTGDYPSLSATDLKVIALTYQLEKELVGVDHLRSEPIMQTAVSTCNPDMKTDISGFFMPEKKSMEAQNLNEIEERLSNLQCENESEKSDIDSNPSSDDDSDWITPSNLKLAQKQVSSELTEQTHVRVACMTTDFAMQNVLKQMNLNVTTLDGRMIKQLRTFILRCYACFKTTSIMTKQFCPKCGLATLKKVAVSLDENGQFKIHINTKRPLTGRGKKFSLPRMKGGKHPNNPILADDQLIAHNRVSKLARTKINPLDDDYLAGFSPFAVRDVASRSAQLGIRNGEQVKYWMRKNPNEARRKRK